MTRGGLDRGVHTPRAGDRGLIGRRVDLHARAWLDRAQAAQGGAGRPGRTSRLLARARRRHVVVGCRAGRCWQCRGRGPGHPGAGRQRRCRGRRGGWLRRGWLVAQRCRGWSGALDRCRGRRDTRGSRARVGLRLAVHPVRDAGDRERGGGGEKFELHRRGIAYGARCRCADPWRPVDGVVLPDTNAPATMLH